MSPILFKNYQNVFRITFPFSTAKIVLFSRLSKQIHKKMQKSFAMSKKSSTFAPAFASRLLKFVRVRRRPRLLKS